MEFDIEKLAKEIVVAQLRAADDAPAQAGEIAYKIAVQAVAGTREKQDPRVTVSAACRGVMSGMLLLEKDLPATSVSLLEHMAKVADEAHLDPAECMTWAMEGIAPVCKMAPGDVGDAAKTAIDAKFMGAGEVFGELLRAAGA